MNEMKNNELDELRKTIGNQQFVYSQDPIGCSSLYVSFKSNPYGIIEKVEEIVPEKVMRVTFTNGDVQKAVCSKEDEFDYERGIEVCLCKHFMGGTKKFNKQLQQGLKCYYDGLKAQIKEFCEEIRIENKKKKRAEQKKRREERRAAEERERQIKIQTEAILRANDIMRMREQ